MEQFEIPKEIRSKTKFLGLEMKEIAIFVLLLILLLTVFKDMVHTVFLVPYFIASLFSLMYLVAPSRHNPHRKNYHSLYFLFKRNKMSYYSLSKHDKENALLLEKAKNEKQKYALLDEKKPRLTFSEAKAKQSEDKKLEKTFYRKQVNSNNEGVKDMPPKEAQSVDKKETDAHSKKEKWVKTMSYLVKEKIGQKALREREELSMEATKTTKKLKRSLKPAFGMVLIVFVISTAFVIVRSSHGLSLGSSNVEEEINQEVLLKALKSASIQDYETAVMHFDELEYEKLDDDDKDVMLLSYLFADQPKKALHLESQFDETVVNYYRASHNMQKIRDLSEGVDSAVIDFELAVDDNDHVKIIELKDAVKMKDNRGEQVVTAFIKEKRFEEAKDFAEQENLHHLVDEINQIMKQKNKNKKTQGRKSKKKQPKDKQSKKKSKKKSKSNKKGD